MTRHVRIEDGFVVEIIAASPFAVKDRFHPDFIATLVEIDGDMPEIGSAAIKSGEEWTFSSPLPAVVDVAAVKAALAAQIDIMAEVERLKYITAGVGQAMEYQQSATEAKACLAAIAADPEYAPHALEYPMLAASVGVDGATIAEVAVMVNAMHEAWLSVGSAIRATRLGTKLAIDAAETAEAAQAVFDAVVWPAP